MNRDAYDDYLRKFNARDYDGVLGFYADRFEIVFLGRALRSREEVKAFYGFLHAHLNETIRIETFVSSDDMIALEVVVRLEGTKAISDEEKAKAGFGWIGVPPPGVVVEIPQFIHYHLKDGKITGAYCAVFERAGQP
jgi:hypothetical protein